MRFVSFQNLIRIGLNKTLLNYAFPRSYLFRSEPNKAHLCINNLTNTASIEHGWSMLHLRTSLLQKQNSQQD